MKRSPTNSTIVRSYIKLLLLRANFRIGGWLRPEATVRRAARLFCTPFASARGRALAAPLAGANQGEIEVDGQRIATYTWGDPTNEPYVLFAHGWSSYGLRFQHWVTAMREAGHAVVAFDQHAHGGSSGQRATLPDFTNTLLAVGQRFGPASAVVGHSLGGAAAALALARGLAAERAILIAPAADPIAATQRFARVIGLAEHLRRRMVALLEAQTGFSFMEQEAHVRAPQIARPALIVHDLEDRDVPWEEGERYARHWATSRLLTTRGLGHNRIADDAGVIEAALRFLRGGEVGERVVSSPNLPYGLA
ncbi:MAG TPA: alpha/beta fold hydrolase [Lysobacter sp.]